MMNILSYKAWRLVYQRFQRPKYMIIITQLYYKLHRERNVECISLCVYVRTTIENRIITYYANY